MKVFIYIVIVCTSIALISVSKSIRKNTYEVVLTSDSEMVIKGKSNVNKFQCQYDPSQLADSLSLNVNIHDDYLTFNRTQLFLNNVFFDCGHRAINKDFHKLLNTDENPRIKIELLKAEEQNASGCVDVLLEITISDEVKRYTIPVQVKRTTDLVMLYGSLPIDINDFGLKPPKKLLGVIKVSNKIEIDFALKVKPIKV